METYTQGKVESGIGVLVSLGIIFGLAIPKFYLAAQVLSNPTLSPETITLLHNDYISEAKLPFIIGIISLLISLSFAYDYTYRQPAKDRKEEAEKDQKQLESKEAYRLEEELELKQNTPEKKEQREREAQSAFEVRKQELERTLRHARNHAARELELKNLRMKIRDADFESRGIRPSKVEAHSDRNAPPTDPLAAVYLTTQEIEQIARQAFTRISILPSSQQQQAWTEWQNDITEKYDLSIRNEIAMCAYHLRGWGAGRG